MRVQILSTCLGALLAGAFLGCGNDGRTIKIGGLAPLTGEAAPIGTASRNGYELAVREWNERGGVLGRQLQLTLRDDQNQPGPSLDAVTRLIQQDRIVALLGANLSQVSLTVAPMLQAAGIPMISPTSGAPGLTAVGDCVHRICSTDQDQGAAGARFAFHDLKARKAACLYEVGNVFPGSIARVFKASFTGLGGKMVAFADHAPDTGDFRPHLARILGTGPDLLYLPDFYPAARLIASEARAQGFKGTLVGADSWGAPQRFPAAGPGMAAGFFTSHFSPDEDRPLVKAFVRKYRDLHGTDPDACAALAYDAGNVLFDAIRRAGGTGGPALKAALGETDFPGVSGQIRFDAQRNPDKSAVIIEIKDGRMLYRGKIAP